MDTMVKPEVCGDCLAALCIGDAIDQFCQSCIDALLDWYFQDREERYYD